MQDQKINLQVSTITLMILIAAFSRIVPHMANFSPLAAIALFGAAHFSKKWQVFLIPIAATWLSDLFINNVIYSAYYPEFVWFYGGFYWQYGVYVFIACMGIPLFRNVNPSRIALGALSSTVLFFLISNFGVWLGSSLYPQNLPGLMACYAAGIPFMKGTLLGDVIFTSVMFGAYYLMQRRFGVLRLAHVKYKTR